MSYTRREAGIAFYRAIGNLNVHPWMLKYFVAWSQIETPDPAHCTLNNILNTTEPGYGCDLLPEWNAVHVKQYPTFEDGIAAMAAALCGGPIFYYPTLTACMQSNNGLPLGARGEPSPEIVKEMNIWSGNANYASDIAQLANNDAELRMDEVMPGRHAGAFE